MQQIEIHRSALRTTVMTMITKNVMNMLMNISIILPTIIVTTTKRRNTTTITNMLMNTMEKKKTKT